LRLVWLAAIYNRNTEDELTSQQFDYALAQSKTTSSTASAAPFAPAPWQEDKHNETQQNTPASSYWVQNIPRLGTIPYAQYSRFNATNYNGTYPVFRNVKDYGAVGMLSRMYIPEALY